jgi:peptidoglycan LD-endopeptidase CwlK
MSRDLNHLRKDVKEKAELLLKKADAIGINLLITCTYRSNEEQADLYAIGRTAKGKIVTNALPGESKHNNMEGGAPASLAFDVVPLVAGKPMWDASNPVWQVVGSLGESVGLKWAGRWKRMREYPHFEV